MIYAVTGAGPRVGTSWTMDQLYKAGLPVHWDKSVVIPGAEYETHPLGLPGLSNVIAKVWPDSLKYVEVGRMVVLSRDRDEQIASIVKQMERERRVGYKHVLSAGRMIEYCVEALNKINVPRLDCRTDELNNRIGEIVDFLSVPFEAR